MREFRHILLLLASVLIIGCSKENPNFDDRWSGNGSGSPSGETRGDRTVTPETRRVLILYSAGFNNISSYLREDIEDLTKGYVPRDSRSDDVLLVISRLTKTYKNYSTPTSPVLIRLTREDGQETVRDTLKVWDPDTPISSAAFLRESLEYVVSHFPAAGYGMIISSHGTGWLPPKYYASPDSMDPDAHVDSGYWAPGKRVSSVYPPIDTWPPVKTLGQDDTTSGSTSPYSEIELKGLKDAFPMHLDYLLVDACLMGCIELAYELKDVCDMIGFSQAEVLADGLQYMTLTSHLLENPEPDVVSVCRDYFEFYNAQTSVDLRSATISLVDCTKLDALADVCADLFAAHPTQLRGLNYNAIQRYFRFNRHFFYDLRSIITHCNLTPAETARLDEALEACIIYKAATPSFILNSTGGFYINEFSGFSMYLPANGTPFLDNYYKENISWNERTGLVR